MKRIIACLLMCCLPLLAWSAKEEPFKEGKDYKTLATLVITKGEKVRVEEFFSYGCPWCYRLEPKLEAWLKRKPQYVSFERVPVIFEANWEPYARAYYTLDAMGLADKYNADIFDAVQKQRRNFRNADDFTDFLAKRGVDAKQFKEIYEGSVGMRAKLGEGKALLGRYKIWSVPAIVVDGRYLIDANTVDVRSDRFIKIVDYLVKRYHR